MFEKIFNEFVTINEIGGLVRIAFVTLVGLVLGLLFLLTYRLCTGKISFNKGVGFALLLLPSAASFVTASMFDWDAQVFIIMILVALAFVLRSVSSKPADIALMFTAACAGFVNGFGEILVSLVFTAVACISYAIFSAATSASGKTKKILKITLPENINYDGLFDEVLGKYTKCNSLRSVSTGGMGTVVEFTYVIILKDTQKIKEFIDEVRVLNANYNVAIQEYCD